MPWRMTTPKSIRHLTSKAIGSEQNQPRSTLT